MKFRTSALFDVLTVAAFAFAGDPTTKPAAPYPLTKCVVSDEALPTDGTAIVEQIDGREVQFCCKACVSGFKKDLAASHKKMDEKIIEASKATYSLKTCLVSDEGLGSMGDPILYVHRPTNQLVEFCCKSCVKAFEKEPAKYLPKLEEAPKATDAK